jgi:hypothetical protein
MDLLKQNIVKTFNKNEILNLNVVKLNNETKLHINSLQIDNKNEILYFKRILNYYPSGHQNPRNDVLKFIKSGSVKFVSIDEKLKIIWTVDLSNLYFLSLLLGLMTELMVFIFLDLNILISILIGVIFIFLLSLFGRIFIKYWINDIIKFSI